MQIQRTLDLRTGKDDVQRSAVGSATFRGESVNVGLYESIHERLLGH